MFYIDMRTGTFKQITEDEYNELKPRYGGEVAAFDVEPDTYWYDPNGYDIYTEDEMYDTRDEIVDDYFSDWEMLMSFLERKHICIGEIVNKLDLFDSYYDWCADYAYDNGDLPYFQEIELVADEDEDEGE